MLFYHILYVPTKNILFISFNLYTRNQLKSYIVSKKQFSAQNHHHQLILYISWLLCCNDFVLRVPENETLNLFIRFWYIFFISYFNYVCELWSPGTVNHCNKHIHTFLCIISMISVLFVYCCFLFHPPHSQLYPYHMILSKKVTTKLML